ncbi:hypothetical protein CORC01_10117 [Colletotrichum orchidophilum]|uniref:Uncharacterized protein n=1 Tax=Colletotrichum orchidophilum TaxID=1209926 RepID=A0A1G4AZI7_9PEZI|nr:uncharacterized protein CORC01_10117 [Colletotrichum orchidophilum]OHE94589.1 hypothetical protein CORC01_10117 [Colletotrichum orchidophilum]
MPIPLHKAAEEKYVCDSDNCAFKGETESSAGAHPKFGPPRQVPRLRLCLLHGHVPPHRRGIGRAAGVAGAAGLSEGAYPRPVSEEDVFVYSAGDGVSMEGGGGRACLE